MDVQDRQAQGLSLPALGFGTMRLKGDDARDGVMHALSIGYRLIDTAHKYGNEAEVGEGIEASPVSRDDIVLVTKLPQPCQTDEVRPAATEALRRLRTDHVDLLLIHWPDPQTPREEVLGELDVLRTEGLTRAVGVCNYPPTMMDTAVGIAPVAVNQVEYHPYLSQAAVLERAERYDHVVMAYAPLARGRVVDDPVLTEIGAAHGKAASQVALRWLIQQDRVLAIPASGNPERREQNAAILDFELSDEEMARIHALDEGARIVDPPHAPDWER